MPGLYHVLFAVPLLFLISCMSKKAGSNEQIIDDAGKQQELFEHIKQTLPASRLSSIINDSISILILPLEHSCSPCRKKTIDSIIKNQHRLTNKQIVIITANGGRKTMNAYFREQRQQLPESEQILLDTLDGAGKWDLYTDNIVIYYAANQKVYKMVPAIPASIKGDLAHFFSN